MTRQAGSGGVPDFARQGLSRLQARIMSNKQGAAAVAGAAVLALLIVARAARRSSGS